MSLILGAKIDALERERDRLALENGDLRLSLESREQDLADRVRENERLKARVRTLEDERKPGPMPHRCTNDDCGIIEYGTGYDACPQCGGMAGRALDPGEREGQA